MHAIALLAWSFGLATPEHDAKNILEKTQQCLVVITDTWSSPAGHMCVFERADSSAWMQRGSAIPVVVGKAGLGWGRGLVSSLTKTAPNKREGDDRAPAGIFRLGTAFGYAQRSSGTRLPYLHLTNKIVAVNDPSSRYYNRLVDTSRIKAPDWRSAESMVLGDNRYKWGVVVEHNVSAEPGGGSCIFLHVWKDSKTATSGCTALPEARLIEIIHWLDPARHPLLVQMPRPIYDRFRAKWNLPEYCGVF
jgi:L,D-peptidoglycan transpeptidase YkuD (ErfK/YbiS/YcfS/YnhG family)